MNTAHSLAESSFSGKIETIITMKLLAESPRRIKVESAAVIMRTERAVIWTDFLLWNSSGR